MEYIKKFDEYINGCDDNINMSLFEELNLEPDNIVYKSYYPKENEDDNIYIRDNRTMLWDFFDKGYKHAKDAKDAKDAKLKGFRSCTNAKSLWKNTSCLKVALFNDIIVAASVYTSFQGGMKCVGITATTDEKYREIGKYAVIQIIKEDISLVGEFYWTVCSDAIERLYEKNGGVKIPNDYLELFISKYKSLSDDGYHFSIEVPDVDGETEEIEKVIFGFNSKETFEYIKNKNDERIMKYINRITNKTIQESVYVKKLSKEDYYTEVVYVFYEDRVDGFKDYSNETMNILKEAVEYLKKFVELNKNNKDIDISKYSTAIWNGEDLIATAIIMDIHNDVII